MANFPIEIMVKLTYNIIRGGIMAEYCLDCFNEMNGTNYTEKKYFLSKDLDFCEGCGKLKRVIVVERKAYFMYIFKYIILVLLIIFLIIFFIIETIYHK